MDHQNLCSQSDDGRLVFEELYVLWQGLPVESWLASNSGLPASATWVLGLMACTITAWLNTCSLVGGICKTARRKNKDLDNGDYWDRPVWIHICLLLPPGCRIKWVCYHTWHIYLLLRLSLHIYPALHRIWHVTKNDLELRGSTSCVLLTLGLQACTTMLNFYALVWIEPWNLSILDRYSTAELYS